MYCPKCGEKIDDGLSFCPKCGADLRPEAKPVSSNDIDNQKSALAAGLLGIFVGCFGVHNFYLHYTGKAVAQLILTITCVGALVSGIWSLIEGILLLTGSISVDGDGKPIKRDL